MLPREHRGLPRSHKGRWRRVLELLAGNGGTMRRAALKERLEALSESHLSHLLRDLEEAEMVARRRPERSREVLVELLPAGREIVATRASSDGHRGVADQAAADRAAAGRDAAGRDAAGRTAADRPVQDRAGEDQAAQDRPVEDRAGEDRGAGDRGSPSSWEPWLD